MKRTNDGKKFLKILQNTNERYREEEDLAFGNCVRDRLNRPLVLNMTTCLEEDCLTCDQALVQAFVSVVSLSQKYKRCYKQVKVSYA